MISAANRRMEHIRVGTEHQKEWFYKHIKFFRIFANYIKTRTAPIYCFPVATLITVILGEQGNIDPYLVIRTVLGSYFLGLATYVYNDLTDFEVDKINKTNRPSVTGKTTKPQLLTIVCIMFGIGLSLTAFINYYTFCISGLFTILGIVYSHPQFKLKDKFPLKTVVTAGGAALLSLLGGAAVLNTSVPILYTSLSFFIFYFILSPLGDIGDIKGDRAVGRRTFPVVIGMKATLLVMFSVPCIIMTMMGLAYGALDMNMLGVYGIISNCIVITIMILHMSSRLNDSPTIKSMRPKMRHLNVTMQISMLLAFL
ncbi:MAG: 4-hydroxybenzoate polyprenyltransferase-like prenyltransferase [Nitrososphaeraceae archaeon]|nr:4-hydroxybenzoate polyprenyltransferase-like prenyltransferase [Nitrososphaeraceae archaeon]MDF2768012.1 4-hydroxybenzoate polyprenyltransferase-like prenyltransferase [Nitrososphaeraceae archaeon]